MKFRSLLTLMCLASINAVDFDGDGVDDTTAKGNKTCNGDCWYEEEAVQESDLTWRDYAAMKEFVMLAAISANQTADDDGSDELGMFKVELFQDGVKTKDLFKKDLNDPATNPDHGTYTAGWKKSFVGQGDGNVAPFTNYDDTCHIKMSLEEIDSNSVTAKCEIVLPCVNTPFAYAPCWIKGVKADGTYDNSGTGENRHGFYMLTYKIQDKYDMDDWGTCDIQRNCWFKLFGRGFFCKRNA